jgi:hypothetical protein
MNDKMKIAFMVDTLLWMGCYFVVPSDIKVWTVIGYALYVCVAIVSVVRASK